MDLENLLLGFTQARLAERAIRSASESERESRAMPNSSRRAFESRMKADAATARVAAQNMEDGKAMVNVAQTSTTAIKSQMQSIRELLSQCAYNDFNTAEFAQGCKDSAYVHLSEMLRLAENAEFNGMKLMDGTAGNGGVVQLQAGNSPRDQKFMNLLDSSLTQVQGAGSMNLRELANELNFNFTDQTQARLVLDKVDAYLDSLRNLENQYSYDYKSLDNLSLLFEEQADIFTDAAERDSAAAVSDGNASYLQKILSGCGSSSILSSST